MKVTYHPNTERGVTHLMYVGDAERELEGVLGATPWSERAPKIAIALGVLALVYWAVTKK